MKMPTPDAAVLQRRVPRSSRRLRQIVPGEGVIVSEAERRAYESDGLTAYRQLPIGRGAAVAGRPGRGGLRYCQEMGVKVVPRGAGTSLSGGALPLADGVLLGMAKFNRILDIDYDNRCVVAQPGVTNLAITHAVEHAGFYYAPDPSSQIACTIGGNVAENSGGVHCLKYGLTTNNRPRRRDGADGRRGDPPRRQAFRCRGLRSAGRGDRLRGAARRRHRGHGAHPAQADGGARGADRLRQRPRTPANASPR